MDQQFVARSRQLMEQIRALSDQIAAIDVANGRCCQPTPYFTYDDDVDAVSEV
jgi:hypothetical protein